MNSLKYEKDTQEIIKNIKSYLISRYGKYQPEWDTILELLADNLDLYSKCSKSVKLNGIYDKETGRKNPLLSTMKDLQATIIKQIQHLGISPYAASKIKNIEEDDSEDYIDELTQ